MSKKKQDKYYLYEIADITKKDERYILDLAAKGLIFSVEMDYADLKLQQCEKEVEGIINGHEIFTTEVIKQEFKEYQYTVLDLYPSTVLQFARGESTITPSFHIKGWNRAIIRKSEPHKIKKDMIFVKNSNIEKYRKSDQGFDTSFSKIFKQKTGPKPNKTNAIKEQILSELKDGSKTVDFFSKNQKLFTDDYTHIARSRTTIMKGVNLAIKEYSESK